MKPREQKPPCPECGKALTDKHRCPLREATVQFRTTGAVLDTLTRLTATGLWGANVGETAEEIVRGELVRMGIRRMARR